VIDCRHPTEITKARRALTSWAAIQIVRADPERDIRRCGRGEYSILFSQLSHLKSDNYRRLPRAAFSVFERPPHSHPPAASRSVAAAQAIVDGAGLQ
jgi:hypothetical protein